HPAHRRLRRRQAHHRDQHRPGCPHPGPRRLRRHRRPAPGHPRPHRGAPRPLTPPRVGRGPSGQIVRQFVLPWRPKLTNNPGISARPRTASVQLAREWGAWPRLTWESVSRSERTCSERDGEHLAATAVWPGESYPLGATYDGAGTNFGLFSEVADRVELCLFDDDGMETRVDLHEVDGFVWHGYLPGISPGQRYGYRVHGPYNPAEGKRCNPHKLLIDPYAKAIEGQ